MTVAPGEPTKPRPRSTVAQTPLFLVSLGVVLAIAALYFVLPYLPHRACVGRDPQSTRRPAVGDCVTAAVGAEDPKVVGCDDPYASFQVLAVISYADIGKSEPDPCLRYAGAVGSGVWGTAKDRYYLCFGPTH